MCSSLLFWFFSVMFTLGSSNQPDTIDLMYECCAEYLLETSDIVETLNPQPTTTTFRVTAYCPCEKCCGKWALNRPKDKNGNPIARGASGTVLIPKVSVASPLPFGTEIELEGVGTVVVHDRTAQWVVDKYGDTIIDLYFETHEEVNEWGARKVEGVIME